MKNLYFRRNVLRFRRFSRYGYAVFKSIHSEVTIGRVASYIADKQLCKSGICGQVAALVAAMAIFMFGYSPDALADELEKNVVLNETVVEASLLTRTAPTFGVGSSVESADIQLLPVNNVNEILSNMPGVDVRERGAGGAQADISVRGGSFDQVLVLLNGVNITDPRTGHATLDIPISLNSVDRVDVIQNVSSSTFGLTAFSGAVNIVTNSKKENSVTAGVATGQYGFINPYLRLKLNKGSWSAVVTGDYNGSDGFKKNTDYKYGNIFAHLLCEDLKSGNWSLQLGGQLKAFGSNSFYSLKYPDQFENTKTALASLSWDKAIKSWTLYSSVFGRAHYDRFELFREGVVAFPSWYKGHNYHSTTVVGGNIKSRFNFKYGHTDFGVEVRNEHILSNVLGDELDKPVHVFFANDTTFFTHGKNRFNLNYFAEQSLVFGDFAMVVGASGNYNTMFGNNFSFNSNFLYRFLKGGKVYASLNRAVRLPTFTDLYYKSVTQIANPNLKPEKALTAEVGASWSKKGFTASLSAYYRYGVDIIDWVRQPGEEMWHSVNHTRVDAWGSEVYVGYKMGYWLKNVAASYSYCQMTKDAGGLVSGYALDYLKHKLTLTVEHGIYSGLGASWTLCYRDRNGSYTDALNNVVSYTPVWLLGGKIYWQDDRDRFNIYVEATNMLNKHYYDYGGVEQPGVWVKVGGSLKLSFDK
ncbi:MAG: TonB-dependent receptor [Bacteroidales bacterium]|nr:TonB-dependent receptor [Bacteroidales bacterium]